MQQIISFFFRNKNFLLFLLLFTFSFFLTVQTHSYHKSKFISSSNFFTGGIYNSIHGMKQYFALTEENKKLLEENNRLKSILFNQENLQTTIDTNLIGNYKLTPAQVLKSSYSSSKNYLTIDKGLKDSIKGDLGVITSKGIVGIVDHASNKYARVMSVLNTENQINAQLKHTDHYGTLRWDGVDPQITQLIDIQKQAPIKAGDTIVTGGRSIIFPKGILIGEVIDFELDESQNYYTVNVKLFNDMTSIGHVHVIENFDKEEILSLEEQTDE